MAIFNIFVENVIIISIWRFFLSFRLALYVYEYLLHVGAQKAAQTFLTEVSTQNVPFIKYIILSTGSYRSVKVFITEFKISIF